MGIFAGIGKGRFFVDGVEVGETQTVTIDTDRPEYTTIKLPNLMDISLSGTFVIGRRNGKSGLFWELFAEGYKRFLRAERISKQIRKSSYRKTKSQRRRG